MKKYYNVDSRYLANGLSFLGFRYYKFNDEGSTTYSFEDTDEFRKCLSTILTLKRDMSK